MTTPADHPLIACTRMYNAAPSVAAAWRCLLEETAKLSGLSLDIIPHSFPNDIEDLWKRPDLGIAFMCGRAFMLEGARHTPIAVPVRNGERGGPKYHSILLVREESPCRCLEDSFGQRLGWTVHHSHSGYIAVREHLAPHMGPDGSLPYSEEVGPLHTPAMCLAALRENRADVAPLDGYYAELLHQNAPEVLAGLRPIAATRSYPMPLLVGAPTLPPEHGERLRQGLFAACAKAENKAILDALCITGFVKPDIASYASLVDSDHAGSPAFRETGQDFARQPARQL